MPFDYDLDFDNLDFRKQPELYRVGRGLSDKRRFRGNGYGTKIYARRYTNYKGGRKYNEDGLTKERDIDPVKAKSAASSKRNGTKFMKMKTI